MVWSWLRNSVVPSDVLLAFGAHLARVLRALFAREGDEVVEGDGLGADEAALEIGVDHAGRLGRGVADVDGQARTPLTPAVK